MPLLIDHPLDGVTIPYFSRFDCYALHFEAKICNLLHFGANIFHLHFILQHLEAEIANLDAIWEPLDLEFLVGRAFVARISEHLHLARHYLQHVLAFWNKHMPFA